MKIKNFFVMVITLLMVIVNMSDFDEYVDLRNDDVPLIKKDDLPVEFSNKAYETIVDFIEKTRNLDYEWVIYFDYVTGEILKSAKGDVDNVKICIGNDEFKGNHVASIHNHPKNILSPPSGRNFGILVRDFEDYELIAGFDYFWILKAKGMHKNLYFQVNHVSEIAYRSSFEYCCNRYANNKIIGKMHDIRYGSELQKFINDKNIKGIQLTKKEYVAMTTNSKTIEYKCRKRITDPDAIRLAREREADPNVLSGKDLMYSLYKSLGIDVDYDEIFAD